jgi:large subunit ribosomal protein L5
MVTYFFFLELISNQKCVLTTSRKNLINLRIKKGSITGCKVTLRRKSLDFFFLTLLLGLPRLEIFKGFFLKKNGEMKNSFSTKLKNLFIFYVLEFEFKNNLVAMDLTFNFNKTNNFEKCFFLTFFRMPTNYLN